MSQKSVTLAGQVLHGRDRSGSWQVKDIDGWFKTPPTKGDTADRPNADGEHDLPVQYGARSLVIPGRVLCRSMADAAQVRERITGLLRSPGRLVVTDAAGNIRWADVKRNGQITADLTGPLVRFIIEAKAVDPRKFGDTATFPMPAGATVSVFHRGNYPATPRITVTGSMPGYTLTVNGASYAVSVPLVSGTPHVIDYNDGRLRVNGLVVQNSIGNTNLSTIPPGLPVAAGLFATSGGTGSAVMELTDTFI